VPLSPRAPHFNPTPPPAVFPRRRIGLNTEIISADTIAIIRKLGITQLRTTLFWAPWVDTRDLDSDGQPDNVAVQAAFDAKLALLDAAGLDVLIMVHNPPTAYATLADGIAHMPAFMASLAVQYPGRTWQIMNEVDDHPYWSNNGWFGDFDAITDPINTTAGPTRGDLYGQLLGPVYDAIKSADPTATVITGATALDAGPFWAAALARAPGKCDAVCVHSYGEPIKLACSSRSIAAKAVIGSLPLWCTEWGSTSADDATQAAAIGPALADNDANNRFDRMYLFTLVYAPVGVHEDYQIAYADGRLRHAALLLRDRPAS
jgi:hypothetical protein